MEYYYQQLNHLWPVPELSPDEVIKIQLEALQNNDLTKDNKGIQICFRFASPHNQAVTGPINHFIELLQNPIYKPLVGFERAEFSRVAMIGRTAQQAVRLTHTSGTNSVYVFILSLQEEDPYVNCWMTDALMPQS